MTSLSLSDKLFLDRVKKSLPKDGLEEATFKLNPKKKGMWKGKSVGDIQKAKNAAKKSGNVTREREAVFALNAKAGKFHKEENMTNINEATPAAEQGHGKKTLGPTRVRPEWKSPPSAEQGHGKRAVTGSLDRKEEVEHVDEAKGVRTSKRYLGSIRTNKKGEPASAHEHGIKAVSGALFGGRKIKYRGGKTKYWGGGSSKKGATHADLYTKEELEQMALQEAGDARGEGSEPTGKKTLGPVRIKADGSPAAQGHGGPAVQGQGKKTLGPTHADEHSGSPEAQGHGGAAVQGHGKIPVNGVICREDVEDLLDAILNDKPTEALEAFTLAIAPVCTNHVADFKEYIQAGLLGVEEVALANEDVENAIGDDTEIELSDDEKKMEEALETWCEKNEIEELDEESFKAFCEEYELDEGWAEKAVSRIHKFKTTGKHVKWTSRPGERGKSYKGSINIDTKSGHPKGPEDRAMLAIAQLKGKTRLKYRGGKRYYGGTYHKGEASGADMYTDDRRRYKR